MTGWKVAYVRAILRTVVTRDSDWEAHRNRLRCLQYCNSCGSTAFIFNAFLPNIEQFSAAFSLSTQQGSSYRQNPHVGEAERTDERQPNSDIPSVRRRSSLVIPTVIVYVWSIMACDFPTPIMWRFGVVFLATLVRSTSCFMPGLVSTRKGDRIGCSASGAESLSQSNKLRLVIPPWVSRGSEYRPKGDDAVRLGSKGRYGSCLVADKTVWTLVEHVSYLNALEAKLLRLNIIQIHDYFTFLTLYQSNNMTHENCKIVNCKQSFVLRPLQYKYWPMAHHSVAR